VEGALISGWPALAFIGCAEMAIMSARRFTPAPVPAADDGQGDQTAPPPDAFWAPVPTDAQSAALIALKATLTAGNPLSGRQLETRFGLSRAEATRVRQAVLAAANGQHPSDTGDPPPDD
jgi:hypothetical protein